MDAAHSIARTRLDCVDHRTHLPLDVVRIVGQVLLGVGGAGHLIQRQGEKERERERKGMSEEKGERERKEGEKGRE